MNNTTTTTKHRRTVAEIREEYARFVDLYNIGITPYEIMRKLNISKLQYKKYFADAISSTLITLVNHGYGTCEGKHLPDQILAKLQATKEDLIRFESIDESKLILTKVDM